MAKMKWKDKNQIEQERQTQNAEKAKREVFKDKSFSTLSTTDKWNLLQMIAEDLGYIKAK